MVSAKPYYLFLAVILLAETAAAETIRIAVASNFTAAAREIVSRFEQSSGHQVKVSYGSSGKLYAQIEHGAPFDLLLAADTVRPINAEREGYAVADSRFIYAKGKLVLWSPKPGLYSDGEAYLRQRQFQRLAIANPKTAPYGTAAQQVLKYLGVWDPTSKNIIRGDSIAQTFQFVATGNASAGLIAMAQLKSWQHQQGSLWLIPDHYYAPIEQSAILLSHGASNPAARQFLSYLNSDKVRSLIEDYGYGI